MSGRRFLRLSSVCSREQSGNVESMLQRGEIPTVVLASGNIVYFKILHPNYRKVGESLQQGVTKYSIYTFNPSQPVPIHP